ncbi:MAG: tetratricopeptide repeat protein [Bacteroidales bacterium]|nr:tetratricopeptide repeat protein [Bacteroidales bacterium]
MSSAGTSYRIILMALCMVLVSGSLFGQEEREYIRKGNKLYKKSEFAGSEGMYRRAQAQEKNGGDAGFNLGDALYRQGRFSEAAGEFSKAAATTEDDSLKQAEGYYNLGNSLLKEQKFEESIGAYINSLKLNPDNIQAKYNLAWAQDQLKKQEEQQKQQDQDKNQEQQQDQNKEDKNDQQDKNDQENQNQDDQQDKQPQQQQDQQPSISREDAKRLLDAMAAREKETQEKVQRDKAAQAKVRVIKNW